MSNTTDVSVLVPIYNVERYLCNCLDTIINQTLTSFEVICVNDGSTDASLDILRNYSKKDKRIKIIDKKNTGYGNSLNLAIEAAQGNYISIVESDDYIKDNMLEVLYSTAQKHELDIVKADYSEVYNDLENAKQLTKIQERYNTLFRPLDTPWSFYIPMMNCTGIFRHDLIDKYHIRFNETPGASHQDMGFWFQTLMFAQSMMIVPYSFYMYRQDNVSSSINNRGTRPTVIPNEYDYIRNKLITAPEHIRTQALPFYSHRRFGSCMYFLSQLSEEFKPQLLSRVAQDFKRDINNGFFSDERFSTEEKQILQEIIANPMQYYMVDYCSRDSHEIAEKDRKALVKQLFKTSKELSQYKSALDAAFTPQSSCNQHKDEMDEKPKVSVIIPVYNTGQYLTPCLDSIAAQTLKSIEIICIDDCSTDNSLALLNSKKNEDPRFHVLQQTHQGQGAARNLGLRYAKGEYIYFMDSDDLLEIDALENLYATASDNNLDVLYFDASTFTDSVTTDTKLFARFKDTYKRPKEYSAIFTGEELFCIMHKDKCYRVSPCLQLIKREYLQLFPVTFPENIIYEDNYFNLLCMLRARRVSHRQHCYFKRRIREGSTMTSLVSDRNVFSYFICLFKMASDSALLPLQDETWFYIKQELTSIERQVSNMLKELPKDAVKQSTYFNCETSYIFERFFVPIIKTKTRTITNNIDSKVKDTVTFKVGKFVVFIPRMIYRGLKCCRDHGIKYTFLYAFKKLRGKA